MTENHSKPLFDPLSLRFDPFEYFAWVGGVGRMKVKIAMNDKCMRKCRDAQLATELGGTTVVSGSPKGRRARNARYPSAGL